MSRTLLARVVLLGVVALTQHQAAAQDGDVPGADHAAAEAQAKAASGPSAALTIGDAAPALDISDWLQDARGRFPHVTNLEPGKIYIVEFWATWCGPCVASMPHVSELQQKYADKGVQVVSVSTEPVETITEFLSKTAAGSEKTYAEITADYCLTTDPDGSVHADYMEAAAQNGIPCAFLVGKEGKVEWIGHPMSIDDVLEQLIAGQWDREAFRKTFEFQQRLEKAMQEVMRLASQQDAAGAYAKLDELSAGAHDESARELIDRARTQVGTMVFYHALEQDQAKAAEMLPELVESLGGTPPAAGQLASLVVQRLEAGEEVSAELRSAAMEQVDAALQKDPGFYEAPLMMLMAKFEEHGGTREAAIEWMNKSIATAPASQRKRLQEYLTHLEGEGEGDEAAAQPQASE